MLHSFVARAARPPRGAARCRLHAPTSLITPQWGFYAMRTLPPACRRRVEPLHGAIPPCGHLNRRRKSSTPTQPGPRLVTPRTNDAPMHPNPRTANPHMNIINNQIKLEAAKRTELKRKALEFTHEPRSQGQRRSFHPQRRRTGDHSRAALQPPWPHKGTNGRENRGQDIP